jgi:neurotransmitter:Na+ symporter, NSS family
VLSLNLWSGVRILDRDIMTFIEFVANDLMLPLGGLLIALFTGWALNRTILREQLSEMPEGLFTAWRWLVRVVAPALVLVVLVRAML